MNYMRKSERQVVMNIAGQPVKVIWKRRNKNLYLRVQRDGQVCVTAPWAVSEEFICSFVTARADWLNSQKARQHKSLLRHEWQYADGELFPLLGERYVIHVALVPLTKPCKIELAQAGQGRTSTMKLCIYTGMDAVARKNLVQSACREMLERIVQQQMPLCEAITGRRASRVDYRRMTSRWGSCNVRTARICLNLALIHYPVKVIRYIIIHELTHLHEPSHNARFHALMDKFCPEWRDCRKILRNGLWV